MIRETRAPDLALSKKRIGRESTCFCTCARSSEIRYWACTLKILVRRKEVTACTVMAKTTARTSNFRNPIFLLGIISSIRYLRDSGATKLAALLITIRTIPIRTKLRLGQMIVLKAFRILTFLSDIG